MSFAISFVPKWKESEPKSIHQNQCGVCVRPRCAAAASDSSRRFCSVTAVVHGSVIWLQRGVGWKEWLSGGGGGGGENGTSLLPVSFLGQDGGRGVVVGTHGAYELMWAGETLKAWRRRLHLQRHSGACVLCVTERWMLHSCLRSLLSRYSLVLCWLEIPLSLSVSRITWLFLEGLDEPFSLFPLVGWCNHATLKGEIQIYSRLIQKWHPLCK